MKVAKKSIVGTKVVFAFDDGEVMECDVALLDKPTTLRTVLHGVSAKVGDSYADASSLAEAKATAKDTWANLVEGKWNSTREGGGKLIQALSRIMQQPVEVIQENYNLLDNEEKANLRKDPRVKSMVSIINGELAQAKLAGLADTVVPFTLGKKKK